MSTTANFWRSGITGTDTLRRPLRQASTAEGNYVTLPVAIRTLQEVVMQAFNTFVDAVREIQSVEQVRAQEAGTYLHLVVYLSNSTLEERYAVYDAQGMLYDAYPDLRLEFDVIDRRGYPVETVDLTGKYVEIIRTLPDHPYADADPEGH